MPDIPRGGDAPVFQVQPPIRSRRVAGRRPSVRAVLVLGLLVSAAAAGSDRCCLWRAASATTHAWLLGSVHLLPPHLYPLDRSIEDAFAESDLLVVELDAGSPVNQARLGQALAERAFLPGGRTLTGEIDSVTVHELAAILPALGLDLEQFGRARPWYVALMIALAETQRLGFRPDMGLDLHFLEKARDAKPIVELETIEEQADLLAGLEPAQEALLLRETLEQLPRMAPLLDAAVTAWEDGDAARLDSLLGDLQPDDPRLTGYNRRLIDDRNVVMAERVAGLLAGDRIAFVVVGAGHLVGERGILALLERRGFSVEQARKRGPAGEDAEDGRR
jgi:uncharacterized protein YbaP (TraB family)